MKWNKAVVLATILLVAGLASFAQNASPQPIAGGYYYASQYNYGGSGAGSGIAPVAFRVTSGGGATGAQTLTVGYGSMFVNGRRFMPFNVNAPIIVDAETVTPSAVSCSTPDVTNTCLITATFVSVHGAGSLIASGSFGLQEAINDAFASGGGFAVVDQVWQKAGGTNTILTAAAPYATVSIEDRRSAAIQNWNPQGGLTTLAAPATLTAVTALPSATPVGAFGTGTYHMCIAYVDLLGQEGPCSADFSEAGLATGSFIFSAPAASTGAVGYTIYIGLTGGGVTNLNYKVPLTSSICTLTSLESITAACSVANTLYGQSGATATVIAITLNTSPIQPAITTVSTTAIYVPNAGGRTTYTYVPGSHLGTPGLVAAYLPFTISAADATTVPSVIGTMNIAPGFMNFVGRTIEVCGRATTTASTATIAHIQFQWDAFGQNTAGKGVAIGDLAVTPVAAFSTTAVYTFCEDFMTTVSGASATAGSILPIGGFLATSGVSAAAAGQAAGTDAASLGAVASLNLASEARLNVIYVHTTGTDGAALTLQSLTAKVVN